jgi:hypothetical protein
MSTIKKSILVALMAHKTWGTTPDTYGDSVEGYDAGSRVSAAGTTWTELHAANLSLQSETHSRYQNGWTALTDSEKDRRGRNYRLAHGGTLSPDTRINAKHRSPDGMYVVGACGVDARVNPDTAPSGLRPRILKAHHKADTMRCWYAALQTAVANTPDGGLVTIPDIDALGDLPQPTDGDKTPRVRVASGPTGFRAFLSLRGNIGASITDLVSLLRGSELPDVTGPVADATSAWAFACPIVDWDKVNADCYDTTAIRVGSRVTLVPGVPQHAAVKFMARNLPQVPDVFSVVGIEGSAATITAEGFKKDIPVPMASLRRFVPVVPVVQTTNWTPTVGLMAWVGGVVEVYVSKVDGDNAVVVMGDDEEAVVALSDLKPAQG